MERNDGKKLKVTAGLVAAGVIGLTVQAQGGRNTMNAAAAEHTLVYGHVDREWVKRTSKLVEAEPELAQRLERIAVSTSVDDVRRGQVLDALAQAGTEPAQKAMRETLTALAQHEDAVYPLLLTKLGQVSSPSLDTVAYVSVARMRAFNEGNGEVAFAAQQTLDSVYGHRLAALYGNGARKARTTTATRQRGE
jgi:hypothetical protein